jgi:hypothetical protein
MYARGYLQGSENGRVVTIAEYPVKTTDLPQVADKFYLILFIVVSSTSHLTGIRTQNVSAISTQSCRSLHSLKCRPIMVANSIHM